MFADDDDWPHEVLIKTSRSAFDRKLRVTEAWLQDWQIPYRVGSSLGDAGFLRFSFAKETFAHAFHQVHGGDRASRDTAAALLASDENDENLYDRLAREYPE